MISSIHLENFRSYAGLRLEVPDCPLVFLIGPNGAGKTNLLEALSILGGGRGLRGAVPRDLIRQGCEVAVGQPAWVVGAEVSTPPLRHKLSQALMLEGGEGKRVARLDAKPSTGTALSKIVPTVGLSPQDDALFRGPAEDRRALLDRFVQPLHPHHRGQVSAYMRAVRERNALLRQAQRDGTNPDPVWLTGLEAQMASHGVALAHGRFAYLEQLASAVAANHGPFPAARLALEGEMEADLSHANAPEVEAQWRARWQQERPQDLAAGRTLKGPHRTDLAVVFATKDMPAALCSTGEQKALLLALFLGQARLLEASEIRPLLLLDEVAAHLDAQRRSALFHELANLRAQSWITGTDAAVLLHPELEDKSAVFTLEKSTLRL